jgi:ribokinase
MNTFNFVAIGDTTTDAFINLKTDMPERIHTEKESAGEELCFNFGDKIEYDNVDIIHGVGNAGNAAVSAARLGISTALITDLGTDIRGDAAVSAWEQDGVDTTLVQRHKEHPTHYHFVLRFGPERTILIKHQPWPYAVPDFSTPPQWIYFSSVGEHGEQFHHDIATYCIEHNIKLAFQPGTFQIQLSAAGKIPDVFKASELFFCNKEEAQRILNTKENDILALLTAMRTLGPHIVIITDGPRGAFAQNEEGTWVAPMYPDPAPPVDRTGAGDAFSSTVTALLASGLPLPDALLRGPINSMNVVQHVGAQAGLLSRENIESLLQNAPPEYKLTQIA